MAPRLNKRQQREQEELLALTSSKPTQTTDLQESSEEETAAPTKTGFAALFTVEDEPEVAASEEDDTAKATKSRKAKKKKKKKKNPEPAQAQVEGPANGQPITPPHSQSKSTSKKAKTKDKRNPENDLDKALAELSVKYPDLQQVSQSTSIDSHSTRLSTLLSVSVAHLDAEAELKKFFGSKAVSAAQSSTASSSPGKRRRGIQPQTQRSHLTRPQQSWGMIKQREGLSARPLTDEETDRKVRNGPAGFGKWWTVEYSKRYKGVTKTFMQSVMTGDPETLWRVLQRMPWHADTLLQLAEVYRHREEYSQAVDYVSRALYAYERAFLGAFSFTNGSNRLDFNRVENRPFMLAVHRQVIDLQRRGCPRTAFEHARLLISLEPLSDPHGAFFHLDYLSVKGGMGDWLLHVWDVYRSGSPTNSDDYIDPTVLPGWSYARALILRVTEKEKKDRGEEFEEKSTEALRQAILAFPSVVPLLADKCEIQLSAHVRGHTAFRIQTDNFGLSPEESVLYLLSHLYAQRSSPLWKSSSLSSWLSTTISSVLSTLTPHNSHPTRSRFLRTFSSLSLRYSIYRHVFVLEQTHAQAQNRALTAFIPPDVTQGRHLACDPLPPPTALTNYDATFFVGSEDPFSSTLRTRPRTRRTQAEDRLLARLIPDGATRAQMVAFFEQNPWIADRVPGGIVGFVQMMMEMPEEELQELMMAAEMMREGQGQGHPGPGLADLGGMPGGMPQEEVEVFWGAEADDGGDREDRGDVDDLPLARRDGNHNHADDMIENDAEEADAEEEEEDVAPMPIRVVRNLLNRLWGGGPTNGEETSDDDAEGAGDEWDRDGVD